MIADAIWPSTDDLEFALKASELNNENEKKIDKMMSKYFENSVESEKIITNKIINTQITETELDRISEHYTNLNKKLA